MSKRLTRIYACGGAAINITSLMKETHDHIGLSDMMISRLDTSDKNIKPNMSNDTVYILEGADGSGKERKHNYQAIVNCLDQMLAMHKPGDYNIVLLSASGGSGSVIGPVVIGELLKRKMPVVALVVGTIGSETETKNSINTLKSLAGVSESRKAPLVMSYFPVNQHFDQRDVDKQVQQSVAMLLNLFDSKNIEIDYKDIVNFLNYTNIRDTRPGLVGLETYNDDELQTIAGTSPLSMASIFKDDNRPFLPVTPDYHATGTRDQDLTEERMQFNAHYVITSNPVKIAFDDLNKRMKQITDNQHSRGQNFNLLGDGDTVDDNGMFM
ncbi:tubulin/FtsZ-like protein [Erwinia phage AH06]|nr:tubulin/FtsZ-like protein [Erwinia phage AH06]